MLQILSGKFFDENDYTKKTTNKSILYSNAKILNKIETEFFTIEPIDLNILQGFSSYVITINGKTLVRDNDPSHFTAIDQFKLLVSFWCQAIFDYDKHNVEWLCREVPEDSKDYQIPSRIVPKYFSQDNVLKDANQFSEFLTRVFNLPRERYVAFLESIDAFYQSLNATNYNLELAFSLLVFSIESLGQKFDNFKNSWQNYDNSVKFYLDKLVEKYEIDNKDYTKLKEKLLKNDHQKLLKRFVDFSLGHIEDSFFKEESLDIKNPINKSDLKKILKDSYDVRSRYVHSLKRFNDTENLYATKFKFEVIEDEKDLFLTFSGLTRLVYHILNNFLLKSEDKGYEIIDFDEENPNMVTVNADPRYWIANDEVYENEKIFKYFYNFLSLLPEIKSEDMIYFKKLMLKVEKSFNSINKNFKPVTVIFYYLCNKLHPEGDITGNFNEIYAKHSIDKIINKLRIESLLCKLLLNEEINWDLDEIIEVYNDYENNKFKKLILKLPHYMELLILIYISNESRDDLINYYCWCNKLICDLPSKINCQKYIINCISSNEAISLDIFNDLYFKSSDE